MNVSENNMLIHSDYIDMRFQGTEWPVHRACCSLWGFADKDPSNPMSIHLDVLDLDNPLRDDVKSVSFTLDNAKKLHEQLGRVIGYVETVQMFSFVFESA